MSHPLKAVILGTALFACTRAQVRTLPPVCGSNLDYGTIAAAALARGPPQRISAGSTCRNQGGPEASPSGPLPSCLSQCPPRRRTDDLAQVVELPLPKTSSAVVRAGARGMRGLGRGILNCSSRAAGDRPGMMVDRAAATGLPDRDERVRHAASAADERRDKDVEILALRHQITVLRWHRDLLARRHAAASRPKRSGRPRTVRSIRSLVLRLAHENPSWGYRRIHGELLVLGIKVAASTVWEILKDAGIDPVPERASSTWADFLRSQADALLACDFLETSPCPGCASTCSR